MHPDRVLVKTIPPGAKRPPCMASAWKICFGYRGRSNPVEEIEFPEFLEARFNSLITVVKVFLWHPQPFTTIHLRSANQPKVI